MCLLSVRVWSCTETEKRRLKDAVSIEICNIEELKGYLFVTSIFHKYVFNIINNLMFFYLEITIIITEHLI